MNANSVMEKFFVGGKWEYVDVQLYLSGRDSNKFYSLKDLTNDGFLDLIMGTCNDGVYLENQGVDNSYFPYVKKLFGW